MATLDLDGSNITLPDGTVFTTTYLTGSDNVTNNGAQAATLTEGGGGSSNIYSGTISDGTNTTAITQTSGFVEITGANAYTGSTTIQAGILAIGADDNIGADAATLILQNGAQLLATASFTLQHTTQVSGNPFYDVPVGTTLTIPTAITDGPSPGEVTLYGGGTVVLTGTNSYSGGTVLDAGTLELGSGGSIAGAVSFVSIATLQLDTGIGQFSGDISGAEGGDDIDLRFQSFAAGDQVAWDQTGDSGGTLSVLNNAGATLATLQFTGQYTSSDFAVASDGNGGTLVEVFSLPPAVAADAEMIMERGYDGSYEFYDLGSNGIVLDGQIGQISTQWQVAGVGAFDGGGTVEMLMRNSSTGAFELYNVSNDDLGSGVAMGQVGLAWTVAGFGDFSGNAGETDMLMYNASTGELEIYDISNNAITGTAALGPNNLPWTVAGVGDFSGNSNETDVLMRNTSTGQFEVYDVSNDAITSTTMLGQVGLDWAVAGFGDFSGNSNETDMLLRNTSTGQFEVYDISNNAITSSTVLGQVGLDWTVAGFGDFSGNPNETDMLLRSASTGQFQLYDINNNQLTNLGPIGQVGLEWSVSGTLTNSSGASGTSPAQLVQAMASFAPSASASDVGSPLAQSPAPIGSNATGLLATGNYPQAIS